MDLGLERAGWTCAWQVEIDDYCNRVLQRHWPDVPRWRDVRTFPCEQFERVDLICGGDPCQANSRARTADGLTQPSLGNEFIRIATEMRPRLILRENPAAVRPDAPWPWWRFRLELESLGYAVLPFRLRACCLGADHQRDRLFLLASLSDTDRQSVRLQGRASDACPQRANEVEAWQWKRIWLDAGPVLRNAQNRPYAGICREADGISARLDGRANSHKQRLRGLGNAVVPQVAEYIGRLMLEHWMTTTEHHA